MGCLVSAATDTGPDTGFASLLKFCRLARGRLIYHLKRAIESEDYEEEARLREHISEPGASEGK